jgi:hypothetical protein
VNGGGDLLAAIILLGLGNVAWPVLFAFRRVSFTAWPAKPPEAPKDVPAAAETGQTAAGAQPATTAGGSPRPQLRQGL